MAKAMKTAVEAAVACVSMVSKGPCVRCSRIGVVAFLVATANGRPRLRSSKGIHLRPMKGEEDGFGN